jgi:hypothetical protein
MGMWGLNFSYGRISDILIFESVVVAGPLMEDLVRFGRLIFCI